MKPELPDLKLLSLTFKLAARDSVFLPAFVGSTLRGAFGTALKRIFCFVPHQECDRCWFFEGCPYQYIFESPNLIPKDENHKLLRGQTEVPHPFALFAPELRPKSAADERSDNINDHFEGNHFARGEQLEFSVVLVGRSVAFWPQVIVAGRLMAETGLGTGNVPFSLTAASAHDESGKTIEVYSAKGKVKTHGVAPIGMQQLIDWRLTTLGNSGRVRVAFTSPARIRIADRVEDSVTPFELLKKVSERLEFLAFLHGATRQRLDYRPLLESFGRPAAKSTLRSLVFEQYSSAQGKRTRREVLVGSLDFEVTAEMLPILIAGEIIGVGANTSYGFGRYSITAVKTDRVTGRKKSKKAKG